MLSILVFLITSNTNAQLPHPPRGVSAAVIHDNASSLIHFDNRTFTPGSGVNKCRFYVDGVLLNLSSQYSRAYSKTTWAYVRPGQYVVKIDLKNYEIIRDNRKWSWMIGKVNVGTNQTIHISSSSPELRGYDPMSGDISKDPFSSFGR